MLFETMMTSKPYLLLVQMLLECTYMLEQQLKGNVFRFWCCWSKVHGSQHCCFCWRLKTVPLQYFSRESKLLEHVKALKVNVGTKPDADLGPVISKQAKERIHKLIQSGVESGARLMLDGRNIVADSLEEAINIINENKYGNGASIFTTSSVAARKFQAEIEAGQVGINVSSSFALFLIYWQQGLICWRSQFLRA
ncbi:hypothetical protein GYH30_037365 [Glycine max]|nr:hypothetical protein GYH30_037365 [Glycine max]